MSIINLEWLQVIHFNMPIKQPIFVFTSILLVIAICESGKDGMAMAVPLNELAGINEFPTPILTRQKRGKI